MLDARSARSRDSCNIAKVGIDTNQVSGDSLGFDILDDDVARTTVLAAVTT